MAQSSVTSLSRRIVLLEEALAEYAQFYGLTPKARVVFADRDVSGMPREGGAQPDAMAGPSPASTPGTPSTV